MDRNTKVQGSDQFPASVAKVIDAFQVVINRGTLHGVKIGQRFLLYKVSDELVFDPTTGQSLGTLEIPKGTGRVIHVQDSMSIVESDVMVSSERKIVRKSPIGVWGPTEEETVTGSPRRAPFEDAQVGDKAKPV